MFTAALFTMARTQKQPQQPSTEEWIETIWHTHTMKCHSDIKNEIMPFQQHAPGDYHAKSTEKGKYHMTPLTCGILQMIQMNVFIKHKTDSDFKYKLWSPKGKGEGKG